MFKIDKLTKAIKSENDTLDVYVSIVTPDIDNEFPSKVIEDSEKIKYGYVSSVTHLRLEECKAIANKLLKNFENGDAATLLRTLATTDQQLYVDIIYLIISIIKEADEAKFRIYYQSLANIIGYNSDKKDISEHDLKQDTTIKDLDNAPNKVKKDTAENISKVTIKKN